MNGARTTVVAVIFFTAVVAVFFGDVLFSDRVLLTCNTSVWQPWRTYAGGADLTGPTYRTDSARTYLPRQVETSRAFSAGRFPLWNPYIFGGTPHFADPQSRVIYPTSLLLTALAPARALGYDVAIHVLIACIGMFLFLRIIGSNAAGAAAGAIAYGFSSFFFTRMGHPTFVAAASWIPYFFYGYEKAGRRERTGVLLLVLFLSLGYLAGMPQIFLFGVAALVVYVACEVVEMGFRRDASGIARSLRVLGISGGLSGLVVAIQMVPFIEFIRNSAGLRIDYAFMRDTHLWSPVFLVRTLVPGFFGNPIDGTSWLGILKGTVHPYNSGLMVYCGVVTVLAALASAVLVGRSRPTRALFVLFFLSLGVGMSAVMLRVFHTVIPFAAYSQIDRIAVIACFALAALGGVGISAVSSRRAGGGKVWVAASGVAGAMVLAAGAVGIARMPALVESMSVRALELARQGWFVMGGFRLLEWVAANESRWAGYETGEITRTLVLAAAGLGLLVALALRRPSRRTTGLLGLVLAGMVVFDVGTAARDYWVDQPAGSLARTPGIEVVSKLVGDGSMWRIGNLSGKTSTFPVNTPQIFGIPSFSGLSTVLPEAYERRLAGGGGMGHGEAGAQPLGEVGDLMCVRYLVAPALEPSLAGSPVLEAVARDKRLAAGLRLRHLDGDARLCLEQKTGIEIVFDVDAPRCHSLDLAVGAGRTGGDRGPVVVGVACSMGGKTLKTSLALDETTGNRWQHLSLDLGSLGQGRARITLSAVGDGEDALVLWSGGTFVVDRCDVGKLAGGYELRPERSDGVLSIGVRSDADDLVLGIAWEGSLPGRCTRRVRLAPLSSRAEVQVDLNGRRAERIEITSEADFVIDTADIVLAPHPELSAIRLAYDGDMYVYENTGALPKGICVDAGLFEDGYSPGSGMMLGVRQVMAGLGAGIVGECEVAVYEPERVEIVVDVDADCFLLLQDTCYPGWMAEIDGRKATIIETDLGFRALMIDPGRHRVVMRYAPSSLKFGLGLAVIGLVLSLVYGVKAKDREKSTSGERAGR